MNKAGKAVLIICTLLTACEKATEQRFNHVIKKQNDSIFTSEYWTFVDLEKLIYGKETIDIPAKQIWVNTGLYANTGDIIQFKSTGTWGFGGNNHDANGTLLQTIGECRKGQLIAKIGFINEPICIGSAKDITAKTSGAVYLSAAITTNTAEELDHPRAYGEGKLKTEIISNSKNPNVIKNILSRDIKTYNLNIIQTKIVEVSSRHIILSLPIEFAKAEQDQLKETLNTLEKIYMEYLVLRETSPYYEKQPIRFIFTNDISVMNQQDYIHGNPVLMHSKFINPNNKDKITNINLYSDNNLWKIYAKILAMAYVSYPNKLISEAFHINGWMNLYIKFLVKQSDMSDILFDLKTCDDIKSRKITEKEMREDKEISTCILFDLQTQYTWPAIQRYFVFLEENYMQDKQEIKYDINKFKEDFENANNVDLTSFFESIQSK